MFWRPALLAFVPMALALSTACSEEPTVATPEAIHALPNLVAPTFGGMQFWSDEMVCHGWRIQRNSVTGHCRLLDPLNFRYAWGSYATCWEKFQREQHENDIAPVQGKVVILLHGLGGWRMMMNDLGDHLAEQGYTPVNVSYASTRRSLDDHAASLAKVIDELDHATQIDFVAHSMGNLVVRRYLALEHAKPGGVDQRIKRMVMLAPPNQGASLARRFAGMHLYDALLGPSGEDLADSEAIQARFATPRFEFAIIAGTTGMNPMISGPNDFTVTVEETRLAGARDFKTLPLLHGQFRDDEKCLEYVARFLGKGYLVSAEQRSGL